MFGAGLLCSLLLAVGDSADEPKLTSYERSLAVSLHKLAREGKAKQIDAILAEHPGLVAVREPVDHTVPTGTEGYSPLDWAAERGMSEAIEVLIRRGAKVNGDQGMDQTPLHFAARKGSRAAVVTLIRLGAKIDVQDREGETPLHWAAERGHLEVVQLLVEKGADLTLQSKARPERIYPVFNPPAGENTPPSVFPAIPARTALEWAEAKDHPEVASYLKSVRKDRKPRA